MLARHRYTRCVNDVGLDAAHLEPARQPDAVTASLEGDCNALDPASCFLRFLSPSMQQLQQCALVDRELFQRLALDARHDTGNEPARQAHDIYACPALVENTYEIVWGLLICRIEADSARDEIVAIFSRCTTYEEATRKLDQRPALCAKAKQPKSAWPLIWGHVRKSSVKNLEAI